MRIGILTSGGDAPGMNAAIRTVVVTGLAENHEVVGIPNGYVGLLEGKSRSLDMTDVQGISGFGGTMLGTARSDKFREEEGLQLAIQRLGELKLDTLIVIGGNGSLTGAHKLARAGVCNVIGIPASIDNDIGHCGLSIGVDTAVNTIVEACDRISDTARSHRRAFLVEVMGRQCGFLAMRAGVAAEADIIFYGEEDLDEAAIIQRIRNVLQTSFAPGSSKQRVLIVKSESVDFPTYKLVQRVQQHLPVDAPGVELRTTILGHVVRGGRPSAMDRVIAQRLAYAAT
ncbi:MAG: 6-phosphofructokinase, partial [Myxococcales bacterium]|nr:6-phosphofructokinase [Myxococcales bacterium]